MVDREGWWAVRWGGDEMGKGKGGDHGWLALEREESGRVSRERWWFPRYLSLLMGANVALVVGCRRADKALISVVQPAAPGPILHPTSAYLKELIPADAISRIPPTHR